MIQQLTKADFLKRIFDFEGLKAPQNQNTQSSVILFYMDEDVLCAQQIDILEKLCLQITNISFFKVDVISEQLLAADLGIRRLPAILFITAKGDLRITNGLLSRKKLLFSFRKIFKITK